MELYTLRSVIALAETKNFSNAALSCFISQSALSQQIAKLERDLGVELFNRTTHGVTLTDAGKDFVKKAREILQSTDVLEADMFQYAGLKKGTLDIGIITSLECIHFGDMLSDFCKTYPEISINIHQSGTHQLMNDLSESRIQVAFLNKPLNGVKEGLTYHKLGSDVYSLAVPSTHRFKKNVPVHLKDLKEERFIFHEPNQVASELCLSACKKAGFAPHIVCRSGSPTTGLYMVRGGLGVAFLPSEEFKNRSIPGIKEIKIADPIKKEVGICYRSNMTSPLIEAMIEFSRKYRR